MRFKEDRQKREFEDLSKHNPKLLALLNDVDTYSKDAFSKEPIITRIFCTKEEEDALYKDTPLLRPKVSPHEVWEGVDLRSFIYTDDEIRKILNYLNSRYVYHKGARPVAMYHRISGNNFHFHIQYA